MPGLERRLSAWLEHHRDSISAVVVGRAPGVDAQAEALAKEMGFVIDPHPADWSRGRRAGPERNARMVATCGPGDVCLAWPDADSVGTYDCARKAAAAGLRVIWCTRASE